MIITSQFYRGYYSGDFGYFLGNCNLSFTGATNFTVGNIIFFYHYHSGVGSAEGIGV